jgi:RecA-family ATPase
LHRRQVAICKAISVELGDLSGKLHLVSLVGRIGNELCSFDDKRLLRPSGMFKLLTAALKATGARFVALDNVAHFFTGNENVRNEVAAFTGLLNQLALDIDGSVLFLGHPNKVGQQWSGSTGWENHVRSRLFVEEPVPDIDPNLRVLTRPKANYARKGEEIRFRWHCGAFLREDDLPPGTAQQLVDTAAVMAHEGHFIACLREMTRQNRNVSDKPASNYAPKRFEKMLEARGSTKKDLQGAMDRLFRHDRIEYAELWRGPDRKPVFGLRETAGNLEGPQ